MVTTSRRRAPTPRPGASALIRANPHGIRTIGIAAYPEGHPLIEPETIARALEEKSRVADYMTTQMCFDPEVLLGWLRAVRQAGVTLPVHVGLPGEIERRRLLEVSMRIGVGPSLAYPASSTGGCDLRRPASMADKLRDGSPPGHAAS